MKQHLLNIAGLYGWRNSGKCQAKYSENVRMLRPSASVANRIRDERFAWWKMLLFDKLDKVASMQVDHKVPGCIRC